MTRLWKFRRVAFFLPAQSKVHRVGTVKELFRSFEDCEEKTTAEDKQEMDQLRLARDVAVAWT